MCKERIHTELFKNQCKNSHFVVTLFENEIAVVLDHDLARETQADTRAVRLGCVEWDEDFVDLP